MVFRFPVRSSKTEVQQMPLQNVKVEKVSDFGHLVAKAQQCFTNESHEKFTKFQILLLCRHYLLLLMNLSLFLCGATAFLNQIYLHSGKET